MRRPAAVISLAEVRFERELARLHRQALEELAELRARGWSSGVVAALARAGRSSAELWLPPAPEAA